MPLRVELNRKVHGAEAKHWIQANAVFKAGRELSGWFFRQPTATHTPLTLPSIDSRRHGTSKLPSPSFIQRLPQELLQEIFHHYIRSYDAPGTSYRRVLEGSYRRIVTQGGARTSPMLLGHVCSSWRTLAFSTPTLWSRLCANRALLGRRSRSSTCPLDLTINQQLGDEEYDEGTELLLPRQRFAHSSRWRKVELRMFSIDSPSPAPHLDLVDWTVQGCKILSPTHLLQARSLRSVEFGTGCPAATDFSDIPLGETYPAVTLGCIEVLNSLTIDTLIIPWPPAPAQSSPAPAPIKPRPYDHSPWTPWSTVRRLVERSSCPIRSLTYSGAGVDGIESVTQFIPELKRLRIACAVGPVLIAALTLNQGKGQGVEIFPLLRSLELPKCRAPGDDVEKLVLSRPLLEKFTLHFLREDHSADLRLFERVKPKRPALQTCVECSV
ncbi:hypothetical protein FA13DRAFT_1738320 [Coprinellus micaceus]|uniref:Uncharacterized protein n=1 Tax=Coprinellus micaceus TaxID=71717 RepID=A0A4Y7SUR3_COPMI|nr:hypothetical protein FA13DRAFT_1738320 [Coprinellus micaceus]